MKKHLESLSYKIQQWMQGRYGNDELSQFLYYVSLALLVLSLFTPLRFLYIPTIALMLWSCIRCYSKNISRRRAERETYLKVTGGIRSWFRLQNDKWRDRKTYRYFRCKECRAPLRVPRGKGKIRVRCPKCHHEMDAKT